MKILILAIGKMKREGLHDAAQEFEKRLKAKIELKEFDIKESDPAQMRKKESETLLKHIPAGAYVVACDASGKQLTSREFAAKLGKLRDQGQKTVVFLIGGADGHSPEVLKKADFALSFGTMTWPHRLFRVMLMEQLYRAEAIAAGSPYHRE